MNIHLLNRRKLLRNTLVSTSALAAAVSLPSRSASTKNECLESRTTVQGHVDPEFTRVRDAFTRNFTDLGELGASVCVTIDGREVIHLWAGFEDLSKSRYWQRDTLVQPASTIKGYFPLCIHKLVSDGLLDYDHQVAKYWPSFAKNGKEDITVRQLLSHMAGLEQTFPVNVYSTPLPELIPIIEEAKPAATPGSYGAYHSQTYMPLIAALVYKVTGEEIYSYFRREIAGPWGIDAWLSLPQSEVVRTAENVTPPGSSYYAALASAMGFQNDGKPITMPPIQGYLMPYTNARAFARAYGAIASGGVLDNVRLFPASIAESMGETQWTNSEWIRNTEFHTQDSTFGRSLQSGAMGWLKNSKDLPMGENPDAFGMTGSGGSMGFADPVLKLGFGYTQNSWHEFGTGVGPRYLALVDSLYACL